MGGGHSVHSRLLTRVRAQDLDLVKSVAASESELNDALNREDDERWNMPFLLACELGDLPIVKYFVEMGANVDLRCTGNKRNALMCAAFGHDKKGSSSVVKYLLAQGAKVGKTDEKGRTALHLAAQTGNKAVVKALIDADIDVTWVDQNEKDALDYAVDDEFKTYMINYCHETGKEINEEGSGYSDDDKSASPAPAPVKASKSSKGSKGSTGSKSSKVSGGAGTRRGKKSAEDDSSVPPPVALKAADKPSNNNKFALLIGNNAYEHQPLEGPAGDVKKLAKVLKDKMGFQVRVQLNRTGEEMRQDVVKLGEQVKGPSVVLFFFAGHGMIQGDKQIMVGVDMRALTDRYLVDALKQRCGEGSEVAIIYDCCRNAANGGPPAAGRGADQEFDFDNIVVHSTASGTTAADTDRDGKHSPLVSALCRDYRMAGEDQDFCTIISACERDVKHAVNQRVYQSKHGDVFLNRTAPAAWRPIPRALLKKVEVEDSSDASDVIEIPGMDGGTSSSSFGNANSIDLGSSSA